MRKVGYIFIVALFIGLVLIVQGAQDCGSVPVGISEDSAEVLIAHDDTVPADQQGSLPAEYRCVNRIGERWPFLIVGGIMLIGTIAWLLVDAARRKEL